MGFLLCSIYLLLRRLRRRKEDAAEAQNASEAPPVEAVQWPNVTAAARAAAPAQVCFGMPGSFLARFLCAVSLFQSKRP